jgi:hypothetical protein
MILSIPSRRAFARALLLGRVPRTSYAGIPSTALNPYNRKEYIPFKRCDERAA